MNARKNKTLEQQKWKKKKKHNNYSILFGVFLDFRTITGLLASTCEWKSGWMEKRVNGKAGEWKSEWMDRLTFVNFRIFLSEISWKPLSAQTEKHATGSRDFPCCASIMASKHCKIMCFYLPPEDHSCSCNVTIEPFVRQRYTLNEECQYHLTHVNLLTQKKKKLWEPHWVIIKCRPFVSICLVFSLLTFFYWT